MARGFSPGAVISKERQATCIEVRTGVGLFALCATEAGVAMLLFPGASATQLDNRLKRYGIVLSERGERRAAEAAAELVGYVDGRLKRFETPVDLSFHTRFVKDVYRALISVPFGEVTTYGELAQAAGHPGSARAVGSAMKRNPAPIFVPCHRVLPASGGLGGWSGPKGWKERLLEREGAVAGNRSFKGPAI